MSKMNKKWNAIRERLAACPLPQENVDPLIFLPPEEWHVEQSENHEVLAVAEPDIKYEGAICLVVDLSGKVYRADWPSYRIYQYCAQSFEQFLLIAERYLSMYRERKFENCEQAEEEFRNYIHTVDPTALADEYTMWSVYAEELGYGF